jgi:predicted nucleic acid-binding protein
MSVSCVLDANVLLYAASKDPTDAAKAAVGLELMAREEFGTSLQIIQEFFHNARQSPPGHFAGALQPYRGGTVAAPVGDH